MSLKEFFGIAVVMGLIIWGASLLIGANPNTAVADPVFPEPTNYVVDTTATLDPNHVDELNKMLKTLHEEAGREIAIVFVPTTGDLDITQYGIKLAEKWGVGGPEDDGVIIVVSMEEGNRGVRMEVGYGAEGYITDAEAGRILDVEIVPFFKQGRYLEGLLAGISAINRQMNGEE